VDKLQMDKLIQKIQASRNVADPTLYGGDLQDNTDIYYKANKLYSQNNVPAAPPAPKLRFNYGATTEIDNRPFMSLALQVPRNPEQEALNEYFNRKRVSDFAVAQSRMNISEQIAKQSELMANNVVRDEMDRRAGIRRSVLDATGYTPAQIEQELAADALAGVNPAALDIRERQVQDAVNLYYNLNNIPLPTTTAGGVQGAISATVPSVAAAALPADDAEAAVASDMAGMAAPEFVFGGPGAGAAEEEDGDGAAAAGLFGGSDNWGGAEYDGGGGGGNWTAPLPEEPRGAGLLGHVGVDPNVGRAVADWNKESCARYITENRIYIEGRTGAKGSMYTVGTISGNKNDIETLRAIVAEHMTQATRLSLTNAQGIGGGK
jgi:hypothetical protein